MIYDAHDSQNQGNARIESAGGSFHKFLFNALNSQTINLSGDSGNQGNNRHVSHTCHRIQMKNCGNGMDFLIVNMTTSDLEAMRTRRLSINRPRRTATVATSAQRQNCSAFGRVLAAVSLFAAAPLSIARYHEAEKRERAAPLEIPGSDALADPHAHSATDVRWPADAGRISISPVALECRPQPFRQRCRRFAASIVVEAQQPRSIAQVRRPEANSRSRSQGNRVGADSSSWAVLRGARVTESSGAQWQNVTRLYTCVNMTHST